MHPGNQHTVDMCERSPDGRDALFRFDLRSGSLRWQLLRRAEGMLHDDEHALDVPERYADRGQSVFRSDLQRGDRHVPGHLCADRHGLRYAQQCAVDVREWIARGPGLLYFVEQDVQRRLVRWELRSGPSRLRHRGQYPLVVREWFTNPGHRLLELDMQPVDWKVRGHLWPRPD